MARSSLKIQGMDCAEEVSLLRDAFASVRGVRDLAFDVLNAKMTVEYDEDLVTEATLIETVERAGLGATRFDAVSRASERGGSARFDGRTLMTGASGLGVLFGFVTHAAAVGLTAALGEGGHAFPFTARAFYLIATLTGAWYVVPKAWSAAARLRPDMNLLMTVAVIGALGIGEWFEAATVSFLFALSLSLESWSIARARRAVAALMELAPVEARVVDASGREEIVAADKVAAGSRIAIKPGERFPLDGKILSGYTTVNQAPISGESMPVEKREGDEVFAGTINHDGAVIVETSKPASESTLSHIAKLVEEAQSKRSPSEQWVERFARYYTPSVLALALLVALVPPLALGASWSEWFYEALVLLVIACPCALVIATPVSIVAALAAAARTGVLIKGGVYVELPARLRALALDKTGTLTEGKPSVASLVPLSGHTEEELLTIAAAIERPSEHPLAVAVVRYAEERGLSPAPVQDYQAVKGKGATATLNGNPVWVGSHRYLEERGHETPEMHSKLEELSSEGHSVVVVGEKDHVCGFITLRDRVREDARDTVAALKRAGIAKIVMLTGDNAPTARAIAEMTGVDDVRAELLPADKVAAIEDLVRDYGVVGMVGDGVNDAPALAKSSLGIAMGAIGSDAALETADIALMKDDLSRLPWLISHAKRTLAIIRQNIVASLGVKAAFVALTLAGHASLWAAIAADMGVSLVVVSNALRLLRSTHPRAENIMIA